MQNWELVSISIIHLKWVKKFEEISPEQKIDSYKNTSKINSTKDIVRVSWIVWQKMAFNIADVSANNNKWITPLQICSCTFPCRLNWCCCLPPLGWMEGEAKIQQISKLTKKMYCITNICPKTRMHTHTRTHRVLSNEHISICTQINT